jgi:hypothetical protein
MYKTTLDNKAKTVTTEELFKYSPSLVEYAVMFDEEKQKEEEERQKKEQQIRDEYLKQKAKEQELWEQHQSGADAHQEALGLEKHMQHPDDSLLVTKKRSPNKKFGAFAVKKKKGGNLFGVSKQDDEFDFDGFAQRAVDAAELKKQKEVEEEEQEKALEEEKEKDKVAKESEKTKKPSGGEHEGGFLKLGATVDNVKQAPVTTEQNLFSSLNRINQENEQQKKEQSAMNDLFM